MAVPSVFPWAAVQHQQSTNTSELAASVYQCCEMLEPVEVLGSSQCTYNDHCMDIEAPSKAVDIVSEMHGKIDEMHQKFEELQCKLSQTESNLKRSVFCFENIKDDELIKFYTGFPDKATLMAFYEKILEDNAMVMQLWEGKRS